MLTQADGRVHKVGGKELPGVESLDGIALRNFMYILHQKVYNIFLQSDAAGTIYFAACFVWLLFEAGYYLRVAFISYENSETLTTAG